MIVLSHQCQDISMLLVQLLLLSHMVYGASLASQPCLSTPCFYPLAEIETINQPIPRDEALTFWDEHQIETKELTPLESEGYFHDITKEISDEDTEKEAKAGIEVYVKSKEDSEDKSDRYRIPIIPRQPLVLFISRAPSYGQTRSRCKSSRNKDAPCSERHMTDDTEMYDPQSKRGRINGLQKWTSAGLPFSVLYHHHKQVSRSKSTPGANDMRGQNVQTAAQRSPDNGQWVSQAGPVVTTRRQYSTLPHLFVSYGWGPLGK